MKDKEPKTLKDIIEPFINGDKKAEMFQAIVKAEAVKWIKYRTEIRNTWGKIVKNNINWKDFMNFFNITEEDLTN